MKTAGMPSMASALPVLAFVYFLASFTVRHWIDHQHQVRWLVASANPSKVRQGSNSTYLYSVKADRA
jgi:hypothetical protein